MTKIQTLAKRMATKQPNKTRPRPAFGGKVKPKAVGRKRRRRARNRKNTMGPKYL